MIVLTEVIEVEVLAHIVVIVMILISAHITLWQQLALRKNVLVELTVPSELPYAFFKLLLVLQHYLTIYSSTLQASLFSAN